MKFAALAAVLFLAACQTQGNDTAPTIGTGLTFAAVATPEENRDTFRRNFRDVASCERHANEVNRTMTRQAVYRGCLCSIDAYASLAPDDLIARHIEEMHGNARALAANELAGLLAKMRTTAKAAYEACGMRYD